jgi:predicted small lipoprotein YifL
MKTTFALLTLSLTISLVAACSQEEPAPLPARAVKTPPATDARGATASGTVIETMNAGGYTYVQVETDGEKVWAAAPEFQVKVGDQVVVPEGMPMRNYHSNTLNRDFALVYFVGSILNSTGGAPTQGVEMPTGHPPAAAAKTPAQIDLSGVKRADGGITVEELFVGKANLSGKEIVLRGKVVKFNSQIMGKNWLHVRDGSGDANAHTNDLTVTTDVPAKVGDTVLVKGKVILDKDFGYGYKYDVIIEDAKVTVE